MTTEKEEASEPYNKKRKLLQQTPKSEIKNAPKVSEIE
jgi:hypothetical protein